MFLPALAKDPEVHSTTFCLPGLGTKAPKVEQSLVKWRASLRERPPRYQRM